MALPPQMTEEEFRDFARKHFPGAPQPIFLPSWVTPSANPQLTPRSKTLKPAIFDTAYNGGFNCGHAAGHASGYATGYTASYSTGYAAGYYAALKDAGLDVAADQATCVLAEASAPTAAMNEHEEVEDVGQYEAEGEEYYYEEEDLGFYSDGTKRTLSDEDIKFYRRSELMQVLKAAKRRVAERREHEDEEDVRSQGGPFPQEAQQTQDVENETEDHETQDNIDQVTEQQTAASTVSSDEGEIKSPDANPKTTNPISSSSSFMVATAKGPETGQDCEHSGTPPNRSTTTLVGDESQANRGKKRKRVARDARAEDDGVTYRRIARELDEVPDVKVELDY